VRTIVRFYKCDDEIIYEIMCQIVGFDVVCDWDETWCLGGLVWRQTPSRFSGWWQLVCQPGSQVVPKHQLGAPSLGWANNPNKSV
jgi:hypothetical protein